MCVCVCVSLVVFYGRGAKLVRCVCVYNNNNNNNNDNNNRFNKKALQLKTILGNQGTVEMTKKMHRSTLQCNANTCKKNFKCNNIGWCTQGKKKKIN